MFCPELLGWCGQGLWECVFEKGRDRERRGRRTWGWVGCWGVDVYKSIKGEEGSVVLKDYNGESSGM